MPNLSNLVVAKLLEKQLKVWDTATKNYTALQSVRVKELQLGKQIVKVQFNPERIKSSAAKVDDKSLKERKCFLCDANRPIEQEGIKYRDYKVLINPFPIFPKHLTIPCKDHIGQRIYNRIGDMLDLACKLDDYTLFYNGPKCGASAPDHMHFQAGEKGFMTLESDLKKGDSKTIAEKNGVKVEIVGGLALPLIVIEGDNQDTIISAFQSVFDALPIINDDDEPMLNILCWSNNGYINLVVVPRKKHRPSCYSAEGDANILISPASVDMGGVFVTPLEKDFIKLTSDDVRTIFDEVCMSENEVESFLKGLKI